MFPFTASWFEFSPSHLSSVRWSIIWVILQNYLYYLVRGVQHRWVLEGLCVDASNRGGNIVLSASSWDKSDKEERALPRLASAEVGNPITISVDTWRQFIVWPFLSHSPAGRVSVGVPGHIAPKVRGRVLRGPNITWGQGDLFEFCFVLWFQW